jgi:geranylgeranyl reductase family protein
MGGMNMSKVHDVVVVGAGPGGSAAAHYLAKVGLDVLLLDKFDFPRDKTCGDALTPRALGVLDDMSLLEAVLHAGRSVPTARIVAPNSYATMAPIARGTGRPGYALVIPRLILDDMIRQQAVASGAKFEGRVYVTAIERSDDGVEIKGGRYGRQVSIRARMAVIATGANIKLLLNIGLLGKAPPMMLAARAYYEEVSGLDDCLNLSFEGVPLPGYGWGFPLSGTQANIGAGFFLRDRSWRTLPATPAAAFQNFVRTHTLQTMLGHARQIGPVQGYPLRVDFATAPTFGERVLLVGEAAGLVNPLTGEGIDYALESGKIAAQHLVDLFATGDLSHERLAAYDRALRLRFQDLFIFCTRMRDLFLHRWPLNRLVTAAALHTDLRSLLVNLVLGNQPASIGISAKTILRALFALVVVQRP